MATPSTPLEDEGPLSDHSFKIEKTTNSLPKSSRKRNRESLDENFDDTAWDLTDDGRPKTRRVNPQRLAIRLGPELVAEMEAHIVPGAKMPTFAVRKDFQERYSVDRRHIYDYFHSRGLRVAKEDKHTNLIRGRALKAQALAQATPKPTTITVKEESPPCEALPTRPFLAPAPCLPKPRGRVPRKPVKSQEKRVKVLGGPSKASYRSKKSIPEFYIPPPVTSSEELSSSEAETMLGASSSGTDTDWESSICCPGFSLSCVISDDNAQNLVSGYRTMSDEYVVGYFDPPEEAQSNLLDIEVMTPVDSYPCTPGPGDKDKDKDTLTDAERAELYNLIDSNIPLALHQSVGSYQSFMAEKSRSYFDHLLPVFRRPRASRLVTNLAPTTTVESDSEPSINVPDIRNWFLDDLDLDQNAAMDIHELADSGDDKDDNDLGDHDMKSPEILQPPSPVQHEALVEPTHDQHKKIKYESDNVNSTSNILP